jgi:hypothetical protein
MSYFKSFELESGHEVLILKNYDSENECFLTQMFIENNNVIQNATVSFQHEQERNTMFENYNLRSAQDFANFMID